MSAYMPGEPCAARYSVRWYAVPECLIGGPYALMVTRSDGRTVSSVTGIRSERAALERAWQYAGTFGTTDVARLA